MSMNPFLPRLLIAAAVFASAACGGPTELALVGSSRAAGADGLVSVEEIEGGNRLVTVTLDHLPPAVRLGEGLTAYVVWFVGNGGPVRAGQLMYDEETRGGRMHATTPLRQFTLKITAERSADAAAPSDIVVADRRIGANEE